jgi:phosphoribosylaminoimidazole carboxylase (NCAIR synthetase)
MSISLLYTDFWCKWEGVQHRRSEEHNTKYMTEQADIITEENKRDSCNRNIAQKHEFKISPNPTPLSSMRNKLLIDQYLREFSSRRDQ